ncbi:MAG: beta-ketoacyl-[acyl-carrier-protein] synthase family protein [Flavobacteriales bacterium]|nr:beta-ketoacyl-[acyl-carrier-protein] synthase family protein [Flavobacteriales bacterium]MBP6697340.1 beta-ketoacyl-[acyl-carrier-protein] synthase family protein [Flavobacteriales bacterium]
MNPDRGTIVITSMGVVSPLGNTPEDLWERILSGTSSAQPWPDLEREGFRSTTACRVSDLDTPLHQRGRLLALDAAKQAVDGLGCPLPEDLGVFIGSTLGESSAFEDAARGGPFHGHEHTVSAFTGALRDHFGAMGPSRSIATACAAGNYAVGAAVSALRNGHTSMAMAGGVEPFSRIAMLGFSRSRAMAEHQCRPFDAERSGMLLGEGAAIFILERANDALARGKRPLAEVVSLGITCDAYHPTAPEPSGSGMLRAMREALLLAGTDPSQVDWVNAHGSGTLLSDSAEGRALRSLFGPRLPLISGSKGALGHALGASSAIELVLCVQGLLQQIVPPTAGHRQVDPAIDIACTTAATPHEVNVVMNNAFAFGGINSTLLLRRWMD